LNVAMLVRKDNIWVSELVSRSFKVIDFQILGFFILINAEIEIALSSDFIVSVTFKGSLLFLGKLVLKAHLLHFLLKQ
jgi:hypothetical protein